jgi:hypothetical protein
MSAIANIKTALSQIELPTPGLKSAFDQLIESLDQDLDRAAYRPSRATEARLQQFLKLAQELDHPSASPEDDDEEQRDTQRLS